MNPKLHRPAVSCVDCTRRGCDDCLRWLVATDRCPHPEQDRATDTANLSGHTWTTCLACGDRLDGPTENTDAP